MATRNIQLRLDENLKQSAESVLGELGLDLPSALRLFLKKVVKTKSIPFRISVDDDLADNFTAVQIRELLASRNEISDPSKWAGPYRSQEETQSYLDSLKKK
ncbi:MAG: addiction module antitoxin, RelB/DinJ family [Verrucomicrobiales bacterium]|nr:addiction module antitoxin, RelB/DinJ family [Verrucomicrobiales bacterium]